MASGEEEHSVSDDQPAERPEDDDYDLLTYGEANARLRTEIGKAQRRLAELEDGGDDAEAAALRERLTDLTEAAERQTAAQREAADFTRFFGFDPKEK
jgi:hypothetical protein